MSKIICSAAIRGAHKIVDMAEEKYEKVLKQFGPEQKVSFPNTGYYLPVIYSILGAPVKQLGDMKEIFQECRKLLPAPVSDQVWLPYLAPALDAGMATFFAEEMHEAMRYVEESGFYAKTEDPTDDCLWLGAADDVIFRKRGIEFVDGTAPGFAAILGTPSDPEIAEKIALELQQKNLYIFMHDQTDGISMPDQLAKQNVQIGWSTRLVPFGPTYTSAVFAMGFACRVALAFGGIKPGDFKGNLIYNKDRTFAFVIAFGPVSDEWYANAAGAINWGFPTISDWDIPQVLPTGICTYEHVVSQIPHDEIVQKAIEVRGLKVTVSKIDIPMAYGPAFEGERVRKDDLYLECGGGRSLGVELLVSKEMDEVQDGLVTVEGPEIADVEEGAKLPLAILAEVAGRQMQSDFEPILERQFHHLINYAQGVMHIGQRNIMWFRAGKAAIEKGFKFEHIGRILHGKLHQDFGAIVDKVQVKIYTEEARVKEVIDMAKAVYAARDERLGSMTDESEEIFYSCTLCQSFAPSHVCVITPERVGMCGAYNWLDGKASFEINPTGPNQPIPKGDLIDANLGQWKGINDFVNKASRGKVERVSAYSLMVDPMTACGCFECIATMLPICNGIMIVNRDYMGMTPAGMKFTTLAGMVGGGQVTPGFLGVSKHYICSRQFMKAEGGLKRVVWMPKILKEEIRDRLQKRAEEENAPDLVEMIADDEVGITEDEVLRYIKEKEHPALSMEKVM
ncbi:MAG: CO dehydrogenase/CO-methylating acetyl-CoA synthase complex subunit beta [Deltaproteobacteria bacterium]|nr:CO dehydrogenase/CO-methylating acetyl-CoA synthase complex subunit beta [Deltaproteobacteria bacterium]MBW1931533.1 CO dehydrogenase/CO-methylating acetyl-CoA synthase complex subunit beta [Deltaproteobacteria bacterium]MBW1938176.1 CO dehydrogenase/CO-methylating acetyl-CoA synthase complex subunit beta [Deltaproteobacteria bacterium]MBW1963631.1 CO dehydrogenase/CO-methylating acetyl-CoA synthase complex subunit beta [Deltaproteobacteria bacterium]MBW2349703.1 CO dehydrogenase/CO-methylat